MTKRYGILAFPAKHSLSPAIHNAAFKALGIESSFGFFEVEEKNFDRFMKSMVEEKISGLAVSLPYKEAVIQYLDDVDESAREIGAVNTIVNRDGKLFGYNTDYVGAMKALEECVDELGGKHAIVIGAGGAARAVIYALLKKGVRVGIYNRTKTKAEDLAKYFGRIFGMKIQSGDLHEMLKDDGDILINTSSIWLDRKASLNELMPGDYVKKFSAVMDIIYIPLITPLIEAAGINGLKAITGDKMFLYQAAEQFELWTGEKAPLNIMEETLKANLS